MEEQKSYAELIGESLKKVEAPSANVQENEVIDAQSEEAQQAEAVGEEAQPSEDVQDDKSKTDKKNNFQKRYNKLHSQYMQEVDARKALEGRLTLIEQTQNSQGRKPIENQEVQEPEFETADDILSYIKSNAVSKSEMKTILDEYFATAKEQVARETKQQEFNKLDTEFKKELVNAFQDSFDEEFGYDDEVANKAALIYERFSKDPGYWSELVKKNGMQSMIDIVSGKFNPSGSNNLDKARQIVNKASKAKSIGNSLSNVSAEINIKPDSSYKEIILAKLQALKSK